jgi:hypothetical protein
MPKRAVTLTAALLTANPLAAGEPPPKPEPDAHTAPGLDEGLANLVPPPRPVPEAPSPPPVVVVDVTPRRHDGRPGISQSPPARTRSTGPPGDVLARVRACESGSNYRARSASGRYGGAYQMDRRTFASVGGSGDPAAASKAEQDYRAQLLFQQRGTQPWASCARRA